MTKQLQPPPPVTQDPKDFASSIWQRWFPSLVQAINSAIGSLSASITSLTNGKAEKAGDTFTGSVTIDCSTGNPAQELVLKNTGANGAVLQLFGDGAVTPKKFLKLHGGTLQWLGDAGAVIWQLTDDGHMTAVKVGQTSDERLKLDWQPMPEGFLEELAGMEKLGHFRWRNQGTRSMGGGAQSFRKFAPWCVSEDSAGQLSVEYGPLATVAVGLLVRRVLELEGRVKRMEERNASDS